MERNRPVAGEFYRHFKGNLYQVIGVAKHSETGEELVVYQALYGEFGLFARPLVQFVGPVDKEKYPDAVQMYRFEKAMPQVTAEKVESNRETRDGKVERQRPCLTEGEGSEPAEEEETIREEILRFLDADGAGEKLKVLREMRQSLDEALVTTMELSMDILPDDKESLERRIDLIERTLEQKVRYEGGRLR